MERQRHNYIIGSLRLLLLLLLTAGAGEVCGQITTEKMYFYQENFGGGATGGWTSSLTGRYTVNNTSGYMEVTAVGNGNNGTTVSTDVTAKVPAGVTYILQFDMKIKGGDNQASTFSVRDITGDYNVLQLVQTAAGGTTWSINGSTTQTVTLETSKWYRFKLHRTYDKTYLTVFDQGTENPGDAAVNGSSVLAETEIATTSTVGGLGRMVFETKRYYSSLCIDNVSVQKWGFDVSFATVALTAADNDNKITSMPTLYNPEGGTLTYSFDGTVLSNYSGGVYPPRIKTAGIVPLTVTIGGKTAGYELTVTSATGGGTYDPANNKYEFDKIGLLTSNTVSSVFGLTMTADGGPTAVVVEQNSKKVLKVIDGNGYSNPFNTDSAYPTMGTYYKFVPSVPGTLTVHGNFESGAILHTSSDKTDILSGSGDTWTATLEEGKTYYLYNGDTTTPLLNYYQYDPTVKSLKFRNPQPLISVDVAEGSYTNPALSSGGYPVKYTVVAGGDIAEVDNDGKVTFKGNYFYSPQNITVTAESNDETVAYTINLVKNTWIFNDNSKWTTQSSELSTGWNTNQTVASNGNLNIGESYDRETRNYDGNSELKMDGTNPLPEMAGLYVEKAASNERLYIAPKNYTTNFLGIRATQLYIPNVLAGQTVTINWTGYNSQAVLDMADAAGMNVTGRGGGTLVLNVSQTGRVRISANSTTCYINSIVVSTPIRAIGTLNYERYVLTTTSGTTHTSALTSYTITDEAGVNSLSDAYNSPENYQSSNTDVVNVDASTGELTAVDVGTAVITATATAKNSVTHQGGVTLVALVEVVEDATIRIRTINVEDLLYDVSSGDITATGGLDRRIPGFDLQFSGDNGAKVSNPGQIIFSGGTGQLTITPRQATDNPVYIKKVQFTVNSLETDAAFTLNGGASETAVEGGTSYDLGDSHQTLVLKSATSASFTVSAIKLYYGSASPDDCLDDSKVAPAIGFGTRHLMRVPADGRAFTQEPTLTPGDWFRSFDIGYTYASTAPTTATINADGTNGQLIASGESTIIATFNETAYFGASSAYYSVSNTLLPDESYGGITVGAGQHIHIEASASVTGTPLTLQNLHVETLTYGLNRERANSYSGVGTTDATLENATSDRNITVYNIHVVTPQVRAWLYYTGQEENYKEQVHFKGFPTGPVAGFRIVDVGDPDYPIDLTDAFALKSLIGYSADGITVNPSTGNASVEQIGDNTSFTVSHTLEKTGQADGYFDTYPVSAKVVILTVDKDNSWTWNFDSGSISDVDNQLGRGWTYENRGGDNFHYGYFSEYTPVLVGPADTYGETAVKVGMDGMLLKDEFRWYVTRGLRVNLSQVRSTFKFPVKKGMEIDVYAATSSADITSTISNVTDIMGNPTNELYIADAGDANPVHNYYLAAEDGVVEVKSTDKVGMYLKYVKLSVPKIHFADEVVTVLNTPGAKVANPPTNLPYIAHSSGDVTYSIVKAVKFVDDEGTEEEIEGSEIGNIATVNATTGEVTLGGQQGWVTVRAVNNGVNHTKTSLEPNDGEYTLYAIDFEFEPTAYAEYNSTEERLELNIDNDLGEAVFNHRPKGADLVATAVDYSIEMGDNARARLTQNTNANPRLTTYSLAAYGTGIVELTAKTGRISTTATLHVIDNGMMFGDIAPVVSTETSYTNTLPTTFVKPITFTVDKAGDANCDDISDITGTATTVTLTGLSGHGALRVTAKDANEKTASFVLTLAYPASSGKKWDFYRKNGLTSQSNHDNKIGDYVGTHLNAQDVSDYVITGTNEWTTTTAWNKIYRNGDKEPRWAYSKSVKCDNAFIIEETAGLQIETAPNSFYVDNNSTAAYTHIGIHSRATITIPRLKNGDLVSLNLSRVVPNNGAIIEATNVKDLAGTLVTEPFTITRSQIDYQGKSGTIPGYYTFIAYNHNTAANYDDEFDVSFTLGDQGYLDVLSIEIYEPRTRRETDNGYDTGYDPENGYDYTMLPVKLNTAGYPDAPTAVLKESEQQQVYGLSYCHPLWSTSVGPARYVPRGKSATGVRGRLDAEIENVDWYSAGGAAYVDGQITVNKGFGKVTVRMENYTADNKYLIGYTPDYTLTVGVVPHQDYPYTWNFTNISGGASLGQSNNASAGMKGDGMTWITPGYDNYELNTDTKGGSFYVAGGTFVSEDYHLGAKGSREQLTAADEGCDEFNGLGITGSVQLRTVSQEATPEEEPTNDVLNKTNQLEYQAGMEFPTGYVTRAIETDEGGNKKTVSVTVSDVTYIRYSYKDTYVDNASSVEVPCSVGSVRFGDPKKRQQLYQCPNSSCDRDAYETDLRTRRCIDETTYPCPKCNSLEAPVLIVKNTDGSTSTQEWGYQVDGGSTKYLVIRPLRRFRNGDVIKITAFWRKVTGTDIKFKDYGVSLYASTEASSPGATLLLRKNLPENQLQELTYTIEAGDGLAGLSEIYIFRALKQHSAWVTKVEVEAPEGNKHEIKYEKKLKAKGPVTITLPDVTASPQDWIYIKSKPAPSSVTNATAATDADGGKDAVQDVFKYKVSNNGNSLITFADGTEIERIGVTHILKPINVVGNEGWATESRDVPIDHSLTGLFTVNDVNAYTVSVKSSSANRVTVQLDAVNSDPNDPDVDDDVERNANVGVPAYTGLVLRQNDKSNLSQANAWVVPLFAPAMTTPVLTTAEAGFLGTRGNRMKDCVDGISDIDETEDINGTNYTRFILAKRFLTWRQTTTTVGSAPATIEKTHSSAFESNEAAAFYRLHRFNAYFDDEPVDKLNTLGGNKAYLLLNTYNLPEALWKPDDPSPSRQYVGILGISDMYEEELEYEAPADDRTYDLRGRVVDGSHLQPGVYIRSGRKVVVR